MKPWFEMVNGVPRLIGHFEDFDTAADKSDCDAAWIFDEEALKDFITQATSELDRARNSS